MMMEILFVPKDINAEDLLNFDIDKIVSDDLISIKAIFNEVCCNYMIETVDISKSADFRVYKASLAHKVDIETGAVSKELKLGGLIAQLKKYTSRLYLDKYASYCLALFHIRLKKEYQNIILENIKMLSLDDLSSHFTDRESTAFIANPFAYYIMSFYIDSSYKEVILIKSDGALEYSSSFNNFDILF